MSFASFSMSLILVLGACGTSPDGGASYKSEEAPSAPAADAAAPIAAGGEDQKIKQVAAEEPKVMRERLVIYTASLSLQTNELDTAVAHAKQLVKQAGGYVGSENLDNSSVYNRQVCNLTFRVPKERFDAVMKGLEGLANYVENKNVQANDITEEFVDNETRLKAKRAAEDQYLQVLRSARNVDEILQVRQYLNTIREEIERIEGRQNFLSNQVGYSTITASYYVVRETPVAPGQSFWDRVADAFGDGWDGVQAFFLLIFTIWPIFIVAGIVLFLVRRFGKKKVSSDDRNL